MIHFRYPTLFMLGLWLITTMALWFLAFYPVGELSPLWLAAAKNACFGTLASGLPDTYGWMILTLAPLSMLCALIVVWFQELKIELGQMFSVRSGRVLIGALAIVVVSESGWVSRQMSLGFSRRDADFSPVAGEGLPSEYVRTQTPAPSFSLVDQHGEIFDLEKIKGKTAFLTFAFAHCQTVCPVLVKETLVAAENLTAAQRMQIKIVVITLDPWRDTPASLPKLAEKWKLPEYAHILSGPVEEVTQTLERFGVPFERDQHSGDVAHPPLTVVVDSDGHIAYRFNNPSWRWLRDAFVALEKRYVSRSAR